MSVVVCDVTEGAVATSSVKLGFTEVIFQAAAAISLLALGLTMSALSAGNAVSYVSADKSYDTLTMGQAASFAPTQLVALETLREPADAHSYTDQGTLTTALATGQATSSVVLSRTTTAVSDGAGTTPSVTSVRAAQTVTERAAAASFAGPDTNGTVVSTANATSAVVVGLSSTATVRSDGAATSFATAARRIDALALASANASSLAPNTAQLGFTFTDTAATLSFAVLPANMDVWVMNTETSAMSRYTGVPVTSIAAIGGLTLGVGDTGLFTMTGATDAGAPVTGSLLTGRTELGVPAIKGLSDIIVGYESTDVMSVRVIAYGDRGTDDYTYTMPAVPADAPRANRVTPGKGLKSRYYQFEILGAAGAEFSINTVTLQVAANARRI